MQGEDEARPTEFEPVTFGSVDWPCRRCWLVLQGFQLCWVALSGLRFAELGTCLGTRSRQSDGWRMPELIRQRRLIDKSSWRVRHPRRGEIGLAGLAGEGAVGDDPRAARRRRLLLGAREPVDKSGVGAL